MKRFKKVTEEESIRINTLQAEYFSNAKHFFDPPYPEGVPERLKKIVASAHISEADTVVDIGTGTGVLISMIENYNPKLVFANDLSESMLESVMDRYPKVHTLLGGIRKLDLPDNSVDVFFVNACYPNLVDKHTSFKNIGRMIRKGGRVVISHPMGSGFLDFLKKEMPFPVDDFPESLNVAQELFHSYGFEVSDFTNEEKLYLLILEYTND